MSRHRAGGPAHPWRRTARTVFQAGVGACAIAPGVYFAATQQEPALAVGSVGTGLAVAAAVTRVMAFPGFEQWLQRFVPWLAAEDVDADEHRSVVVDLALAGEALDQAEAELSVSMPAAAVVVQVSPEPHAGQVAGPASPLPDGTPVVVRAA